MQRTVAVVTLAVALALLVAGAGRGTEAKAGRPEFARHPPVSADSVAKLARAGGKLWTVDGCQVSVVSLTTLTVKRAAGAHCQVWPNPSGTLAVATIGSPSSLAVNRRLAVFDARGTSLRQIAEIDHPQGALSSPVAWQSDTDLSFCVASESSPIVFTSTEGSGWHLTQADPGRCLPQYDGARKFETEGASVLAQGVPIAITGKLVEAMRRTPDRIRITALDVNGPFVGAAVGAIDGSTTTAPYALVELDRRTGHNVTVRLGGGSAIDGVGLPPDGGAAWVSDVTGGASIVPGPSGTTLPGSIPEHANAYAWSPDGSHLAVARAAGVDVYTVADGTVVGVPGVHAEHLSWSR
jgi:hypothetical protein